MLSAEERASFAERGWLRLHAAFPRDAALEMQRRTWAELHAVHGIVRERPETWLQPRFMRSQRICAESGDPS